MTLHTIQVSDSVYRRLVQYARASDKAINQYAEQALDQTLPPTLDIVPERFRADLSVLPMQDDAQLWMVTRQDLNDEQAAEYEQLLQHNANGQISSAQQEQLANLREQADLLMFRRSYAFLLLKRRGHQIPSFEQLNDES